MCERKYRKVLTRENLKCALMLAVFLHVSHGQKSHGRHDRIRVPEHLQHDRGLDLRLSRQDHRARAFLAGMGIGLSVNP